MNDVDVDVEALQTAYTDIYFYSEIDNESTKQHIIGSNLIPQKWRFTTVLYVYTLCHLAIYFTPLSARHFQSVGSWSTIKNILMIIFTGLHAPCSRDGTLHASHRSSSFHHPPKDVYFHVRGSPLFFSCCSYWYPTRSESRLVAKLQYGMKITFIFILILFVDSVNRVYRVQVELAEETSAGYDNPPLPSPRTPTCPWRGPNKQQ